MSTVIEIQKLDKKMKEEGQMNGHLGMEARSIPNHPPHTHTHTHLYSNIEGLMIILH